jgi:hypothetical protein
MPFYLFNEPPGYNKVLFFENDFEKSKHLQSEILEYKSLGLRFTGTINKIDSLFNLIYIELWNVEDFEPYKNLEFETTIFENIITEKDLEQKFGDFSYYAEKIISLYYGLIKKYGKDLIVNEFPNEIFDMKFIESMVKVYENDYYEELANYMDGNSIEYKEKLPKMSKWEKLAEAEEIMKRIQSEGYY